MERKQRTRCVALGDGDRDVQLRRSLGDGHDIDVSRGDGRERARGDAGRAAHAEADDGDERDALLRVDAIDQMEFSFGIEGMLERGHGMIGFRFWHDEADARLARCLADHRHGMSRLRERGERASGHAGDADHSFAFDGDERLPMNGRQCLDRIGAGLHIAGDARASARLAKRVAHEQRDVPVDERDHRARMQHVGAVVGQFRRFSVMQLGDDARRRDALRIGSHQAVHFLEKRQRSCADAARDDGRREVAAAASKSHQCAIRTAGDVAGEDDNPALGDRRQDVLLRRALAFRKVRPNRAEAALGMNHVDGIDVDGIDPDRLRRRREDPRHGALAARNERILRARSQLLQHGDALHHRAHLARGVADELPQLLGAFFRRDQFPHQRQMS